MRISLRSRSSAATTPVPPDLQVLPVLRARPARREFPALTVLRVPLVPPDLPGQSVRWVLPVLLALRDLQASRGLSVPPVPPGRPVPRVRWVLSVPPGLLVPPGRPVPRVRWVLSVPPVPWAPWALRGLLARLGRKE